MLALLGKSREVLQFGGSNMKDKSNISQDPNVGEVVKGL
jgi:hypothetical protein